MLAIMMGLGQRRCSLWAILQQIFITRRRMCWLLLSL